mgnify:CR=1 FL=1
MQNINPLWKQEIEEYPAMPDFLKRILIDETPEEAIDLIAKLLEFEPQKRLTAEQAMSHPFFAEFSDNATTSPRQVEMVDEQRTTKSSRAQ